MLKFLGNLITGKALDNKISFVLFKLNNMEQDIIKTVTIVYENKAVTLEKILQDIDKSYGLQDYNITAFKPDFVITLINKIIEYEKERKTK
jgi:hypothetical protein